ncbi:MAG: ABC transporter transmembrane domain-containing protein, partial [Rubrivivax sp.]
MFQAFERLVDPYPQAVPEAPPKALLPFLWACSQGTRGYIAAMTLFTAGIGAFEALLFAFLGRIVDWLARLSPAQLWAEEGDTLLLLAVVLSTSIALAALQTMFKHQTLAGNFPMRLRWNFHRLMLGQSMGFFQDEFAGRIATKVMQSALAVREVWMIVADILTYVLIYFVTMGAVLGSFDLRTLGPFVMWFVLYMGVVRFFVPRLARVAQEQADARSLMTGRITDAYTNIATVKLFSHSQREAGFARTAMQEFMTAVHGQMRLVSAFEIVNQVLSVLLIGSTVGVTLWLWSV